MAEGLPKLWTKDEVCERYNKDRTTITRWVNRGEFPRPMRLPGNQPMWTTDQLIEYERSRMATQARD